MNEHSIEPDASKDQPGIDNKTGSGLEFHACMLQDRDGKWLWAVVSNRADSDGVPDIIGFYASGMDANDAAWTAAKEHGGRAVYFNGKVGQP